MTISNNEKERSNIREYLYDDVPGMSLGLDTDGQGKTDMMCWQCFQGISAMGLRRLRRGIWRGEQPVSIFLDFAIYAVDRENKKV
jgi:hypothetical protein